LKIVQFIPGAGSWGDLTPDTMRDKGLGGRETALVQLAEAWADAGHEVINFVPTETPVRYNRDNGGSSHYVGARSAGDYLVNFGADVLISWEEPRIFREPRIRKNVRLGIIEMQVANMVQTEEQDDAVDFYAVLSEWAGRYLVEQDPYINREKLVVFPNGVDMSRYETLQLGRKNDVPKFYYSSSPDRGLINLLRVWPQLTERFPGAEINIAYGLDHWINAIKFSHNMHAGVAVELLELVKQPGVRYLGRIGQNELARVQQACDALLYPCDTMQPTETGCITVVEAGAASAPALITDCDCLGAEFGESAPMVHLPFQGDAYVNMVDEILNDEKAVKFYQERGYELAESRHWPLIAQQWLNFFEEQL
jgi:glycosyltransferase involved in cell wall biosynthesis